MVPDGPKIAPTTTSRARPSTREASVQDWKVTRWPSKPTRFTANCP
jgi:hypothetical protein